jgi:hypothetical protein
MTAEPTVKCPVEDCGAEKLKRGIHLHVRQSKGSGHGPQGEVPSTINLDDLETSGSQEVSMDYPETRQTEQVGRRCPFCKEVFRGKQGVMIHLGRVAGDGSHPQNPKEEIDAEKLTIVHLDEDGNVVEEVDEPTTLPSTRRRRESERENTLEAKVQTVIEEFRHEGKDEVADRLEEILTDD